MSDTTPSPTPDSYHSSMNGTTTSSTSSRSSPVTPSSSTPISSSASSSSSSSSSSSPSSESDIQRAESIKSVGNKHYSSQNYELAVKFYTEAISIHPYDPSYYGNRSAAYLMIHEYEKALQDSLYSIEIDPKFKKGYVRASKCYCSTGKFREAKDILLKQDPDSPDTITASQEFRDVVSLESRMSAANGMLKEGRASEAARAARELLKESPGALMPNIILADALIQMKQSDNAKLVINSLMKSHSDNSDVLRIRGSCLYYSGQIDAGIKHFQTILRDDPDNNKTLQMYKMVKKLESAKQRGNTLFSSGQSLEAIEAYTEALSIDPLNDQYNSTLYCNRAAAYMKLERWSSAAEDCSRSLSLKNDYIKAWTRRSTCRINMEMYEDAIRDLESALKIDSESVEIQRLLRQAKLELKKSKRKDYYKILAIPKNASANDIKKAYRKMALTHHPDKNAETEEKKKNAELKFKDINEAYEVLGDEQAKRRYDSGVDLEDEYEGHGHGGPGPGGADMNDILRAMFMSQMGGGRGGGGGGFGGHGGFGGFGFQ